MTNLDRAVVHAMLDILIDDAEAQHDTERGLSIDSGGGPDFAVLLISGENIVFTPNALLREALDHLQFVTGGMHKSRQKRGNDEALAEIEGKLKPKKPSKN